MNNAPFEILESKHLPDNKIPAGYTAIYILVSNVEGQPNKPFYVGQTSNLQRRFYAHDSVTWHWYNFGTPAKVFIAGVVLNTQANEAEQNLIRHLSLAKHALTNAHVFDNDAYDFQDSNRGKWLHDPMGYASKPHPRNTALMDWQKQWIKPIVSNDPNVSSDTNELDSLFVTASGIDIRTHAHYLPLPMETTRDELVMYVSGLHHSIYDNSGAKNPTVMYLLQKIAYAYDETEGYSQLTKPDLVELTGLNGVNMAKHLATLSQTGLWARSIAKENPKTRYYPLFVQGAAERYYFELHKDEYDYGQTESRLVSNYHKTSS